MASSNSILWPDPNSPLLAKIDFGVPVSELLTWLLVRDTFFGENWKDQDIAAALALVRDCKHPDAMWLASVCKDVSTKDEAREVFLSHQSDARALCFAWHLAEDRWVDLSLARRAADMGNVFAGAALCREIRDKEYAFRLAQLAAAQNERDGFFELAFCFEKGVGCEKNLTFAKQNYLIAAELGDVIGARKLAQLLDDADPALWMWLGRIANCGNVFPLVELAPKMVEQFFSGSGSAPAVFFIGRAFKGHIDMDKRQIFDASDNFDSLVGLANQAISFYDSQIKCARLAVDTWTLVGIRLGMVKDMRVLIGKMIWEGRFEANYKI